MRHFTNEQVRANLPWPALVEAIRQIFLDGCELPDRLHYDVGGSEASTNTLLVMPAWVPGKFIGVKTLTVFPGNGLRNEPAIDAVYLLFDGLNGKLLASMDATELTSRRTAATSALAASYLARGDARTHLILGSGKVAHNLALAFSSARPLSRVLIWNRTPEKAQILAGRLEASGLPALAVRDLEAAVRSADIVSAATLSESPLIKREWIKPGTHIDLVGAFKPSMRESDDETVREASVFVDTRRGSMEEAGDLVQPLHANVISTDHVLADLSELVRGIHPGRRNEQELTLFKSVGVSSEDLAAACLVYSRLQGADPGKSALPR
jgi:ornithine cyclodeaminase